MNQPKRNWSLKATYRRKCKGLSPIEQDGTALTTWILQKLNHILTLPLIGKMIRKIRWIQHFAVKKLPHSKKNTRLLPVESVGRGAVGGGQWAVGSRQWAVGGRQWAVGGANRNLEPGALNPEP